MFYAKALNITKKIHKCNKIYKDKDNRKREINRKTSVPEQQHQGHEECSEVVVVIYRTIFFTQSQISKKLHTHTHLRHAQIKN